MSGVMSTETSCVRDPGIAHMDLIRSNRFGRISKVGFTKSNRASCFDSIIVL